MQMLSLFQRTLERAELAAQHGDAEDCLRSLRALPLADFGSLMFGVASNGPPAIAKLLPKMADVEVQRSWTGTSGFDNLKATVNFVQSASYGYQSITGKTLRNQRILDYGCGYGRMIRLMYYFSDPTSIYGCDPWPRSIEICQEDRLLANLAVSEYLPSTLPFPGVKFDFVYANSVFTHTSERATRQALRAIRGVISETGILAITIRPVEFWAHYGANNPKIDIEGYMEQHRTTGFMFHPHNRAPVDGDITYGDTSMSYEYLETNYPDWKVCRVDRTLDSPYQMITFLQPR